MLITSVYNTVDIYFVSFLGTAATASVGVVFPLMAIIQAVGYAIGTGAAIHVARLLSCRNYLQAEVFASSALFCALICGSLLCISGFLLGDTLLGMLGATPTILPYARVYIMYILLGAPVMASAFTLNVLLRFQGMATRSMLGLALGAALNLLLDPLFIFIYGMGVRGAALATILGQCFGFGIMLFPFIFGQTKTRLRIRSVSKQLQIYQIIARAGLPSAFRQGFAGLSVAILNTAAGQFGDEAVAAVSIASKLFALAFSAITGFCHGYQPVLGYSYSAERYDRARSAFRFTLYTGTLGMLAVGCVIYFAAPGLIRHYTDDIKVLGMSMLMLRAQCAVLPLIPLSIVCNMTYQAIDRSIPALFFACARQGIFFIPMIWMLPTICGVNGLLVAQAAADFLTFICALPFASSFIKHCKPQA